MNGYDLIDMTADFVQADQHRQDMADLAWNMDYVAGQIYEGQKQSLLASQIHDFYFKPIDVGAKQPITVMAEPSLSKPTEIVIRHTDAHDSYLRSPVKSKETHTPTVEEVLARCKQRCEQRKERELANAKADAEWKQRRFGR